VIAEVRLEEALRVVRAWAAVDVGRVVNPDGVKNQIEGGVVQAASWTLKEAVRFDRHFVTSLQWEQYPILTFAETPQVTVDLIDRPEQASKGAGEGAQGPTGAAIANALFNAAGVRVRELPLTRERIVAAIQ
jgi:CO/xanthine dehydrogenase Mo-binding subunit